MTVRSVNDLTSFKWATVRDIDPLSIQLDGDSVPLALIPESLVDPRTLRVLDRVRVELSQRKVVIHGMSNGARLYSTDVSRTLITTSLTSGLAPSNLGYERRSGWVFVSGRINRNPSTAVGNLFSMPPGFRPEALFSHLVQGAGVPRAELTVTPEGMLALANNVGAGDVVFSFSYPAAP